MKWINEFKCQICNENTICDHHIHQYREELHICDQCKLDLKEIIILYKKMKNKENEMEISKKRNPLR